MFDKTINVKTIDLSGVNLPSDDEATCALIHSALSMTNGFPLFLENFRVNEVKHDSVLVNPIIEVDKTIINLNDCHLIVTPTEISVGKGVYGASLESIVDKDGNPRFVEGDITMETITGVTQTYGKWSLSGSHLMIVLCGTFANGSTFPVGKRATINLPDYIESKIVSLKGTKSGYIDYKNVPAYNNSLQSQLLNMALMFSNNDLIIANNTAVTLTDERSFRIQFDLLIDDEYE